MANYANTKSIIAQNIYTNHEGKVTAEMVKTAANEIVNTLIAGGYLYAGVAHPGDAAVSPDANVFYIASEAGTYTNKGGLIVADGEVAIFKWNGTWSKEVTGAATAAQLTELGQNVAENTQDIEDIRQAVNEIQPIVIEGDVTNAPDEEDITTDDNDLLKFANRTTLNGKGYKILRRNRTFAEQVTDVNTIYEIRYDFDLGGNSVTIPANCIFNFNGGSLSNGTIIGNKTRILYNAPYNIFNDCEISGFNVPYYDVRWFGAIPDGVTDCTAAFERAIAASNEDGNPQSAAYVYVEGGTYLIANEVQYKYALRICGNNSPRPINGAKTNIKIAPNTTAFKPIIDENKLSSFVVWVKNLTVCGEGSGTFLDYGISGAPARPGEIENCDFYNLGEVFTFKPYPGKTTVYCNLHFHDINAAQNQRFIVAETDPDSPQNEYTIDCCIEHSCIENNRSANPIYINNGWGNVSIKDVLLEGQNNAVYVNLYRGHILIEDCYFEGQTGDYSIYAIAGSDVNSSVTVQRLYGTQAEKKVVLSGGIVNHNSIPMEVVVESDSAAKLYHHDKVNRLKFLDFGDANSIDPSAVIYLADKFNGRFCYRSVPVNTSGTPSSVAISINTNVTVYDSADVSLYPTLNNGIWLNDGYDATKDVWGLVYIKYLSSVKTPHGITIWNGQTSVGRLCTIPIAEKAGSYAGFSSEDIAPNKWLAFQFRILSGIDLSASGLSLHIHTDCDIEISNIFIFDKPTYFLKYYRGCCNYKYRRGMDTCINMAILDEDTKMRSLLGATLVWETGGFADTEENIEKVGMYVWNRGAGTTANRPADLGSRLYYRGWKYFDTDINRALFWVNPNYLESDGVVAGTPRSGLFSNKPTVSANKIYIGFQYFCTDRQTAEGSSNGIMIFHKGSDVWVDALGRTIS